MHFRKLVAVKECSLLSFAFIYFICSLNFFILISASTSIKLPYRPRPGLKWPKKTWWAKPVTNGIHTSGRLTERQIKYAAESGFKSLISIFYYGDDELMDFGGEHLPTTSETGHIAKNIVGLQFTTVLKSDYDDWVTVEAVQRMSKLIEEAPFPVLVFCNRGYAATFLVLLHLANVTKNNNMFAYELGLVNSDVIYETAAEMGYDFTFDDAMKELVSSITGEPIVANPVIPDVDPEEWLDYWPAIPVYKNWFIAGQFNKHHIPVIEATGFKLIVNMRKGITHDEKPSQEQVTLLNIEDETGTYNAGGRQSIERLLTTRIGPKRPVFYIGNTSDVNYESINLDEFGDGIGYNEEFERRAVEQTQLQYHFMPIDSNTEYGADVFDNYKEALIEVGKQGPVLLHCASAYRVAFMGVLAAAYQYEMDADWALNRLQELGYIADKDSLPDVYHMYKTILKKCHGKTEL